MLFTSRRFFDLPTVIMEGYKAEHIGETFTKQDFQKQVLGNLQHIGILLPFFDGENRLSIFQVTDKIPIPVSQGPAQITLGHFQLFPFALNQLANG